MERIEDLEEQIAMLKNAAAQSWKTETERKRLIEEAVKLEVKVLAIKNR
jgi:hypothetical protein